MNDYAMVVCTQLIGLGFATLAAVFFLIIRRQNIDKYRVRLEMIQKERLVAMEKGIPMPELPDYDNGHPGAHFLRGLFHPRWALGLGLILISGGIGTTLALHASPDPELHVMWSMGLVPAFLGVGFVLHYLVTRKNVG